MVGNSGRRLQRLKQIKERYRFFFVFSDFVAQSGLYFEISILESRHCFKDVGTIFANHFLLYSFPLSVLSERYRFILNLN